MFASSQLRVDLSAPWTRLRKPPLDVGAWSGKDRKYPPGIYKALPGSNILLREYSDPVESIVSLTIISSPFLSNFHNPEFCYTGAGFQEVWQQTLVIADPRGGPPVKGTLLVMQNVENTRVLLYGWYVLGEKRYIKVKDLKGEMSIERLLGTGGIPSYFVSVVTPLYPNKDRATRSIERFVQDLIPYVEPRYAYTPYVDKDGKIRRPVK